jgi:long-chain acyl-CoA synthetase
MHANGSGHSVVLLTGATGMVGRELAVRMARTPGTRVICPIRAASDQDAERRLSETLARMPHQPLSAEARSRMSAIRGDITEPRLGLDAARWEALAAEVTRIVHGAANVSWSMPLDEARRINVGGTMELLRLADAAAARGTLRAFDYISTVMVAGKRKGVVGEEELDESAGFWSTYEQTKAEAERLVRSKNGSLPVSIFRLSMVIGDSRTGHTSAFNVMYWPLKMLSRGVFWIVPADPNGIVDVVPVDFAADAIEALSADPAQRGKSFHIAAGPDDCCTVAEFLNAAVDILAIRRPILVNPSLFLAIVRPLLYTITWGKARESLKKGRVYLPYVAYRTRFDVSQARAGLAPHGLKPPHVRQYLPTIIAYAKEVDWGARFRRPAR